jgi:uroporphyrinogen decarboxylase
MNEMQKPDKRRLLAAFHRIKADRVPNLEFVLMRRNTAAIIGEERLASVEGRYQRLQTVWPPRSESEIADRSPLARYSCYLPPEEYRMLLERTGQDAIVCTLSWKPKSRKVEHEGAVAMGQEGIVRDRSDLQRLPPAPALGEMLRALDSYIDFFRGSAIGIGVLVRSVLCNTYETLGMENFMLKMHDDPGLIESLFEIFFSYSLAVTRAASEREVDFLAIDDDICDNNGFLVNPDFIRSEWAARTQKIIEPFLLKGMPVVYHCCGNVKALVPLAIEMGISALHPLQPNCNDIYAYKKRFGGDLCLMGNMDLAGVLSRGTPDEVRRDTEEHIERLAPGGGYIVASSHSIIDDVPPENYRAMIETAWEYGRW